MFRRLPFGAVPGRSPICHDTNDPQVVEFAFKKRLFRDIPRPNMTELRRFELFVKRWLLNNMPTVNVMSFFEWLETTTYTIQRKEELTAAYTLLRGSHPTSREAEHIDTFVKSESYPELKFARMINSRCDAFKAWSGPMFKSIEEVVYQLAPFIKHVPVPDRPERINSLRQSGRRYFMSDFTAFESHFTKRFMRACELQLYRHCLAGQRDADFLCDVISGVNRMRTRHGHRASCTARRMSGDMCTSLGNGFSNLMLALYIADKKGGSIEGFVEGDDGLFSSSVELTSNDYLQLGFTIKIEEIKDPSLGSFCGMIFTDSNEILRDPFKFLQTFGFTHSFIQGGKKVMMELLRAKALSACYETPNCPIVGAMAHAALRFTEGFGVRYEADTYHQRPPENFKVPDFNPSPSARELFGALYGITPCKQLQAEAFITQGDLTALSLLLPAPPDQEWFAGRYLIIE